MVKQVPEQGTRVPAFQRILDLVSFRRSQLSPSQCSFLPQPGVARIVTRRSHRSQGNPHTLLRFTPLGGSPAVYYVAGMQLREQGRRKPPRLAAWYIASICRMRRTLIANRPVRIRLGLASRQRPRYRMPWWARTEYHLPSFSAIAFSRLARLRCVRS